MRKIASNAFLMFMIMVLTTITAAIAVENFTPDQIKDALPNKTKHEVKELLGSPTAVSQNESDESGQWVYTSSTGGGRGCPVIIKGRIIFDEVTEKAASNLTIWFKDGVVQRVKLAY